MKCPACGNQLEAVTVENLTVDVCRTGCGGIWFDNFELDKVDEPHETLGEKERDPQVTVDSEAKRPCPKCGDVIMLRHFFNVKQQVEIDECPKCAGFWLDYGELAAIREQFTSAEERQAAEQAYMKQFDAQLDAEREETQEKLEHARSFAKVFRFICPSYYIPGKQDGAAF
jgi:hypothetical protein